MNREEDNVENEQGRTGGGGLKMAKFERWVLRHFQKH